MKSTRSRFVAPLVGVAVGAVVGVSTLSAAPGRTPISATRLEAITLAAPVTRENVSLTPADAQGPIQIIARLRSPAVTQGGSTRSQLVAEQAAFIARIQSKVPTALVLGSTQLVLNAVFLELDAAH